jgi:heterodisulfide reductase subunit C
MDRVDPDFMRQVRTLGAFDATACYNCGTCTATCPLSDERHSFPRKMIRYALLGLKDEIRRSPELWLCYYCGECSDTCPRAADPGALMMALRRYAIARTSLGRIAGLFYHRTFAWILWGLLTAFAAGGVFLARNPRPDLVRAVPLSFIKLGFLHDFGIAVGIYLALVVFIQMIWLARSLRINGDKSGLGSLARSLVSTLYREVLLQKKHRTCEKNDRYVAHLAVFWGFMGLFLATILVFGADFFGFPEAFRVAAKVVGVTSGVALIYGCLYFIFERLRAKNSYSKASHPSDWAFLLLLGLSGLTGFALDIFKWLNLPWPTYIAFAVHLVAVFDLLITLPFTKFAHALYRPLAVWLAGTKRPTD